MQVTTIYHVCSATKVIGTSSQYVSAYTCPNISTVYPIVTGIWHVSALPLSCWDDISSIASTLYTRVSAQGYVVVTLP